MVRYLCQYRAARPFPFPAGRAEALEEIVRRPYHGGQNAREWRRKVAAVARKQRESVSTYKFGLETQPGDIDFDAAACAYDVTEGIAKGSLIGLVCAVHLSGFRLFSKGDETRRFRNRSRYPERAFADALRKHAGIENSGITIQSIEDVFTTRPQASEGVELPDGLARRLFQAWNRRSPRDDDHGQPTLEIADGIGREVAATFGDWKELAGDVAGALACADTYLATLGPLFPTLASLPPLADTKPENCTFAHDPESPFIDMTGNEEIWLHQAVAVCAGRLVRDAPGLAPPSSKFATKLKDAIVTRKNNGLSWLFGNGLRYLRASDAERIAGDLSIPSSEIRRAQQLKTFADAIPPNPFFDTDGYAEFRGSVGGKVSSWVANYWKRVHELSALHSEPPDISIPPALRDDENASVFSGQHTDAAGLEALSARLPERIREAGHALAVLRGDTIPRLPGPEDIAAVERVAGDVAELAGQTNMLENRIEQEIERSEDENRTKALKALERGLPKSLKEPPRLNRISGGADDAESEIKRLQDDLNAVMRERRGHYRRLAEWAGDLDPLPVMAERERKALSDRGKDPALADEQTARRLLHRIVGMSRRLSPDAGKTIRDTMTPLFQKRKDANRYFHNRQGTIYRHPFSTSRHEEYAIDTDRARETDWLAWLENRVADIRERLAANTDQVLLRDLLAIEGFVFTHRLGGLPDRVPGELARLQTEDHLVGVPPLLAAQLDADEVSRDVAARAFNLFNSAINGLSFRAFRDGFIVRTKFLRLEHEELFYTPKDKSWRPPGDYLSAKGEISKGLTLPSVVRDEAGAVLSGETAKSLSKAEFPEPGSRALLRQAPHDWFVEIDLRRGEAPDRAGLPVKKNATGLKHWRRLRQPAFRLIGPPSFKTWLDRALTSKGVKLGDYTLILDHKFKQFPRVEGEEIRLAAEPVGMKAELAVPVINDQPYPGRADDLLFDNIVAIDLGEKRIGFAVFSLVSLLEHGVLDPTVVGDGKPAVGTVAVPAFRKLMAAVRRHRKRRQPNQKVGQTYSKALMQFRENVIGDVCNRIDTLCERFNGFPILESRVGNFESGGRQLGMIYGSVSRRYTFSNVDAHKAARRHYWFTAEAWEHPYVLTRGWNERTRTYSGRSKPLTIFPGAEVNPAGTSQTCHRCGRNALAALRDMPDDRIDVGEDGAVVLGDGTVRLLDRADYSPAEHKGFKRRKERPPLNAPVRKGSHRRRDLERIVRRNMRQRPRSEMSPDTTQARFVCIYEDCGFQGHADENAAINIGRRFLERIDIEESSATLRALTEGRK